MEYFLAKGIEVSNVDIVQPRIHAHLAHWRKCSILDPDLLLKIMTEVRPSHVVHLAARATVDGKTLEDYRENTTGTANVLASVKKTASVRHVIVTSSQHVRKPGSGLPVHDEDFIPHGVYGESKVVTEQLTRSAGLPCLWTIIRPTTIWGPWHPFLPDGLWKVIQRGIYVHPQNDPVIRCYGYVKNTIRQIESIFTAPSETVDRQVFYLGDGLMKQIYWINAFANALIHRDVRQVPRGWIRALAKAGDFLGGLGIKIPMNSPRYFNLTTSNPVPIEKVIHQFGVPDISLENGIAETLLWLGSREGGWR
jgi:nucleoside-diphosphate-sugar epimerase